MEQSLRQEADVLTLTLTGSQLLVQIEKMSLNT